MTNRERLALVMDENENQGDCQAVPMSLTEQLEASIFDALTLRQKRVEKQLDKLMALPEIIAALARAERRKETY